MNKTVDDLNREQAQRNDDARRATDGTGRTPPPQYRMLDVDTIFTYHPPVGDDSQRYEAIRAAAKELAKVIVAVTPACADQSAAIRHVREAVMTANASIAIKGAV